MKMPLRRLASSLIAVLAMATSSHLHAQTTWARAAFDPTDAPFRESDVQRGVQATRDQCALAEHAVWASVPGRGGECLRYTAAGLAAGENPRVLVFLDGDMLDGNEVKAKHYSEISPLTLQAQAERHSARLGVPYIYLARPGTYGSSGDHHLRRQVSETELVSAALDSLMAKYQVRELVLAGQSGGGFLITSLLAQRSDIVCAVPASSPSSPKIWRSLKGRPPVNTYEPVEHLENARRNPKLRVFVLGDPEDRNVFWPAQTVLADALQSLGVQVETLRGEGTGPMRHGLRTSAKLIASMCLKDASSQEILARASQGLKG